MRRLSLVPVPMGITILGISVSQVFIGLFQGVVITFLSFAVFGIPLKPGIVVQIIGIMLLIGLIDIRFFIFGSRLFNIYK